MFVTILLSIISQQYLQSCKKCIISSKTKNLQTFYHRIYLSNNVCKFSIFIYKPSIILTTKTINNLKNKKFSYRMYKFRIFFIMEIYKSTTWKNIKLLNTKYIIVCIQFNFHYWCCIFKWMYFFSNDYLFCK